MVRSFRKSHTHSILRSLQNANAGEKRRETYSHHVTGIVLQLKHEENGEDPDWVFASTMTYGKEEAPRAIRTAADPYICWHLLLSQRAAAVAYSTNALSLALA
jgi:hypothetical protein